MDALAKRELSHWEKIGIPHALLMPLIARANAHRRFPQLQFRDIYSELILEALTVGARSVRRDVDSMLGSCLRSRWIEEQASSFWMDHPNMLGVSVGAGLDTLYMRLCDSTGILNNDWYDIDHASVIALKRELLTETNRYRLLDADPLDPHMIERLEWRPNQPALFVVDGVLMNLPEQEVISLIKRIAEAAAWRSSEVSLLFDYCSPYVTRLTRFHSALRHIGIAGGTTLQWSLEDPRELCWLHPLLEVHGTYDLTRECGPLPRLIGWIHRRLTGHLLYGCVHLRITRSTLGTQAWPSISTGA